MFFAFAHTTDEAAATSMWTDWKFPGTTANTDDGGDIAWRNTDRVKLDNGLEADCPNLGAGGTSEFSQRLDLTNFGFSVPAGTVDGIEARYECRSHNTATALECKDNIIKLIVGGSVTGDNKAESQSWGGADHITPTVESRGGIADDWGAGPSVAQVNASNFGFSIKVNQVNSAPDCYIDYCQMRIRYTPS